MIMTAAVLYSVYCLCNGRSGLQAYVGPPQFSVFQNIHSAPDPRSLLFVGTGVYISSGEMAGG